MQKKHESIKAQAKFYMIYALEEHTVYTLDAYNQDSLRKFRPSTKYSEKGIFSVMKARPLNYYFAFPFV